MTSFPGSPRLIKGALVGMDPINPLASVVVFQYNPDTMTRRLEARSTGGGETSDRSEAFRLTGPPKETITLNIEVDGTDQLEQANPITILSGISPTLAALEMLLYPKSDAVITNAGLAQAGNIEIIPPEGPLTLFVWGPTRVLPVRVTGFSKIKGGGTLSLIVKKETKRSMGAPGGISVLRRDRRGSHFAI